MLHDELVAKWGLDAPADTRRPVWLGEFGAGYRDDYWRHMVRFIEEYDLDWAYWPINGDTWDEGANEWRDEWYGVLEQDYFTIRRMDQYRDLRRIQ